MKQDALDGYQLIQELYLMLDDSDRRVLRDFSLTNRQYHALQHLLPGSSHHLTELSRLLLCDKSNVTGLVERMVRGGLITRERSDSDRRFLDLSITTEGETLRRAARRAHEQSIEVRLGVLSDEEQQQLNALLGKLAAGLRQQMDEENE